MQRAYITKRNGESAYLTVYLSLVFGIVLSLLLALIEGAAIGAVRLQAEIIADLGLDSVFAEYNREILDQYGLFFIDSSYGTKSSGIGMVENHLSEYMEYNLNPTSDKSLGLETMLLYLENPYLEINKVSYATDDDALVWKSQAVNYMKSVYGGDIISTVQEHIKTVEENNLNTTDVISQVSEDKKSFEEGLSDAGIIEYSTESDDGYSYDKVSGVFDNIIGGSILSFVTPTGDTISSASTGSGNYYSSRKEAGTINSGIGVHDGEDTADGIVDELIFNEYLMTMCGTYTDTKDEALLNYQIEYILYGFNSDEGNMQRCVEVLYALRAASDLICIYNDSVKKGEVEAIALVICTLLGVPKLAETLTNVILGIWALAEAASDVNILMDGGKVPLMKSSDDWNVTLTGLFSYNILGGTNRTKGLSYNDYMRVFLGIMNKDDKLARSLDIVEMDIRKTDGNENFRIDACIDYVDVSFGFNDGSGHEFLFNRSKCYE